MTPNGNEAVVRIDTDGRKLRSSARPDTKAFPLTEILQAVCYWTTVLLLAVVGGYVLHWRWTHTTLNAMLVDDPWGVITPPWIVEVLLPIAIFGYLAEACRQAFQGNWRWKHLMAASVLVGIVGTAQRFTGLLTAR
jgi:hypothetical protein